MPDVLLFPSEPNPEDVTLREGGVAGPATYTVNISATAVGVATAARTATYTRTFSAAAVGVASAARRLEAARQAAAAAVGVAAVTTTVIPGPATYTVGVSATAVGAATVATSVLPAAPPSTPPPGGGGWSTRRPAPPTPTTHVVYVAATAHCRPSVTLTADHAGRRAQEDELVLAGAI